jgi:hypothetical protein
MPTRPGLTGIPASWAGGSARFAVETVTEMMPLARYFVIVGGALMALLFVFDFFSPKASADSGIHSAGPVDKTTMRIRSDQKLPERIVFDTTQPTIAAKAAQTQTAQTTQAALPGPEPAPEITAKARVRETFAQFAPVEPKKADTAVHKKKKTARAPGQPMHVARYSYFGTSTW